MIANDAGTASSDTSASSGLIVSIMISTPTIGEQRRDELGQGLLERLADVVDVVRDTAQQVTTRTRVEGPQGDRRELAVDPLAQPIHGALGDARHDVRLTPAEERAAEVRRGEDAQDAGELAEVDARTDGGDAEAREQVRLIVLAGRAKAGDDHVDGCPGRDLRGQLRADRPLEDDVGRLAQQLGAEDGEADADHRQDEDHRDARRLRPKLAQEPPERPTEVLRLLGRQAHAHAEHAGPAAGSPRGRSGRCRTAGGARGSRTAPGAGSTGHATASDSDSCENTISR